MLTLLQCIVFCFKHVYAGVCFDECGGVRVDIAFRCVFRIRRRHIMRPVGHLCKHHSVLLTISQPLCTEALLYLYRLCIGSCPKTSELKRRCIDVSFLATGCPVSEPPEFYAIKNGGQCPPASQFAWGETSSINAWPYDRDDSRCSNGAHPVIWDAKGVWDTVDDCKKYVESLETASKEGLFAQPADRGSHRRLSVTGAVRQDWGADALAKGKSEQSIRNMAILSDIAYADTQQTVDMVNRWTCPNCRKLPHEGVIAHVINDNSLHLPEGTRFNLQAVVVHDPKRNTNIVAYVRSLAPWRTYAPTHKFCEDNILITRTSTSIFARACMHPFTIVPTHPSYRGTLKTSIWNWLLDMYVSVATDAVCGWEY